MAWWPGDAGKAVRRAVSGSVIATGVAIGGALTAFVAGAILASAASAATTACRIPGLSTEVQCGTVQRPLDPADPAGPVISVSYAVMPAVARRKLADPVFLLAGGPGQSATALAGQTLPLFSRLNQRRDIVFVDQRGTGRSAPLMCDEPRVSSLAQSADAGLPLLRAQACLTRLAALPYIGRADRLGLFTTTLAMQDVEAVRQALGAPRINLVGASYGTRAALEYQRQFPAAVRRSVLDGVAPPDMALPASGSTDAQAALQAVFAACESDADCAAAHPRLRADWAALLAGTPRQITAMHPLTGQRERFTLTRETLLGAVRTPLYVPAMAAALPQAISDAAQGRYDGLFGLASVFSSPRQPPLAAGMHFSVVCAEDLPRIAQQADAPGADFGRDIARRYEAVCAGWPRGAVDDAFYRINPSATPVLLLSGGLDPATPPRHAERAARALGRQARHVVVPHAGHGVLGLPCMADVMTRFIDAADDAAAAAIDADCALALPRPPVFRPLAVEVGR